LGFCQPGEAALGLRTRLVNAADQIGNAALD
jgi:hypothetical protein